MKVQLVVVRGKPEGKVIPLVGPNFKIGRGETCHLRPNSEQVSREHAEFTMSGGAVMVRDLGSRNGTLVNGKAVTADPCRLKDRDLVQVGPLTFAVSILDSPATAAKPAAAPVAPKTASLDDDISGDDIDAWLVGPSNEPTAERPTTAVYGGDTMTIAAFREASSAAPKPTAPATQPASVSDEEYERQPDDEAEEEIDEPFDQHEDSEEAIAEAESEAVDDVPEEFLDPSNPFYAAKKAQKEQTKQGPAKPEYKDTSDAASDILRRLMERRRAERSS